jgi:hypothetical protein
MVPVFDPVAWSIPHARYKSRHGKSEGEVGGQCSGFILPSSTLPVTNIGAHESLIEFASKLAIACDVLIQYRIKGTR